jgi:hypothetical protein
MFEAPGHSMGVDSQLADAHMPYSNGPLVPAPKLQCQLLSLGIIATTKNGKEMHERQGPRLPNPQPCAHNKDGSGRSIFPCSAYTLCQPTLDSMKNNFHWCHQPCSQWFLAQCFGA